MAFTIASAPHGHSQQTTTTMMRMVLLALLPGVAVQVHFFGYGVIIQLLLATLTALLTESLVLLLRQRPIGPALRDSSAILTAALLAVALPPLAPWWLVVSGTAFAILVAKQLYGGLGHNPFNPAMVAYVLLLVSFPSQMTSWLPAHGVSQQQPTLSQAAALVLHGTTHEGQNLAQMRQGIDGTTSATPLDSIKTQLGLGKSIQQIQQAPEFIPAAQVGWGGIGWMWVNVAFLAGGLLLLALLQAQGMSVDYKPLRYAAAPLQPALQQWRLSRRALKGKLDADRYAALLNHELMQERQLQQKLLTALPQAQRAGASRTPLNDYLESIGMTQSPSVAQLLLSQAHIILDGSHTDTTRSSGITEEFTC